MAISLGMLFFILISTLKNADAFTIFPIPGPVTMFTPVVVSWARDSGDPSNWHLEKQNMKGEHEDDVMHGTSEPLLVSDGDSSSGEVTITFTHSPGSFRLLAFDDVHAPQTVFFSTDPTITAVRPNHDDSNSLTKVSSPTNIPSAPTQTPPPVSNSSTDTGVTSNSIDPTTTSSPTPSPTPPSGQPANAPPSALPSTPSSDLEQSSSSKVPIIVGGVLGGIVFILLLLIFGWVMRRRRRRRTASLHSVIFHRDMMVRQRDYDNLGMGMGSAEGPVGGTQKLEDSRVFRFEGVSTGIGRDGGKPSVRTSPISNYSESVAREDEGKGVRGFRQ